VTDDVEKLVAEIRSKAGPDAKIVFVSGYFNVIHPGHQRILNFAAGCGDFLVVGVLGDNIGSPPVPEALRRDGIAALNVVSHAFILRVPPEQFIAALKPAIVVKGSEHRTTSNVEQTVIDGYGGKLLFSSGDVHFSSVDLLRHELQASDFSAIRKPDDYPVRHGFSVSDLIGLVNRFPSLRLVVAGDLIVDEYIDCDPLGMSREDPTLVVTPVISKQFVGGAGIVAAHARGLGAKVSYFGICADDDAARFATRTLRDYGVECHLQPDESRPTTLKQRFRAANKTLLRVSHLRQHDIGDDLVEALSSQIETALADADLMIFADFNYGCLPQTLVDRVTAVCQKRGIPIVADSQASSQIGDVSRFRGALLMAPTEHEARLAMRDSQSGLIALAESLRRKANARHVLITLASEGIVIHSPDSSQSFVDDRLPAFNTSPKDVSGAGDCLLTCTAMALVTGADVWQSAYLGSVAAACQVSRIGNTPLKAEELIKELTT
jgi:rfaE bifunctional protein kinase chain/domain